MPLSGELLALLRCPETLQPLSEAAPPQFAALESLRSSGALRHPSGATVAESFEGLLIREDGRIAYPVRAGIPLLLLEEAIVIQ